MIDGLGGSDSFRGFLLYATDYQVLVIKKIRLSSRQTLICYLQHPQHVSLPSLRPDSLGVPELHLQELGGSEDGGQLVARLEQLAPRQDLRQETAVGPEVGWRPRRGRLEGTVVVDGAVSVVPPPVLDDLLLHPVRGLLHLLQVAQSLVLPGLLLAPLSRVAAQPGTALRPVRTLLQHHHHHHHYHYNHHHHRQGIT